MAVLTAGLILGIVLCYLIALPFLSAIVWSVTLAVLFRPLQAQLCRRVPNAAIATSLTVIIAAGFVVIPMVMISSTLINEVIASGNLLSDAMQPGTWTTLAGQHPAFAPLIRWIMTHVDIYALIQGVTGLLGNWSASVLQGSVASVVNLLLTFYFLFYILRDHDQALAATERLSTLRPNEFTTLVERINSTVFATVYGTAVVAALQGVLGGLMFWWLGLPSPLFWGVVMGLLAVVPFLGAFLIWAPAAFVLAMKGDFISAALLTSWGLIVVGLVDNVLYPILVGRRLALHSMPAFIAIIGGLVLFGSPGVVLGPVIVAGTLTLLDIWRDRIDARHDEGDAPPAEAITAPATPSTTAPPVP
jgi:predicted PurR-regulated permease PerM